uniref:Uncharacterized protein n=1 Tax=Aegilops tauschii subsp. strangulata TaxID=200361 RepID=A0A453PSU1_AEGTS
MECDSYWYLPESGDSKSSNSGLLDVLPRGVQVPVNSHEILYTLYDNMNFPVPPLWEALLSNPGTM